MTANKDQTSLRSLTVLLTGAASGIGRALAVDLCKKERCKLILLDRDELGLKSLQAELQADTHDSQIKLIVCDLGLRCSIDDAHSQLQGLEIDVLINNAGVFSYGTFENTPLDDFEHVIDVNLIGTIRLTKGLLPTLLRSPRAAIVNMISLAGLMGAPGMCAYSTSKFGLMGFSESLRAELDKRVYICTVCPSFVKTNIVKNSASGHDEHKASVMDEFLQRFGASPNKVAEMMIDALKSRKTNVLINPDAHFLYFLDKLFPYARKKLVHRIYRHLSAKGVI